MERRELVHNIISELRERKERPPFQPTSDIDMVWVVSNPGTVFTPSQDGIYAGRLADREIVDAGVERVRQITALRMHKDVTAITKADIDEYGPIFYYNGEDREHGKFPQNEDLQELVNTPDFPIPAHKVIIDTIDTMNTPGQVRGIAKFLHIHSEFRKIAVVGRTHHQRRVARYLEHYKENLPSQVKLFDAAMPETKHQVGLTLREVKRIVKYAAIGDLSEKPYF